MKVTYRDGSTFEFDNTNIATMLNGLVKRDGVPTLEEICAIEAASEVKWDATKEQFVMTK